MLQYMKGIPLLSKAIQKIQLFPSQLTSIHADLCQVYVHFVQYFVLLIYLFYSYYKYYVYVLFSNFGTFMIVAHKSC